MKTSRIGCALGLVALLGLAAPAGATPTIVSAKAKAIPIPGFPGTGDKPGAGAIVRGYAKIAGTEYDGSPAPLTGLTVEAPPGTKLNSHGFATCAREVLEQQGPPGCPKSSKAGPPGEALGTVTFGSERVPEKASLQPFFAPGGSYELYVFGHSPALVEIIATAHQVPAKPPFGLQVVGEIPLIETVPEGLDASFLEGTVEIGTAYRHDGHTHSFLTLPPRCTPGGWPLRITMTFLGGGEAVTTTKLPCARG
jgi:hypothetical protein